jgi:hypothetical protein
MTSPVARCDAGAARLPTFAREEQRSEAHVTIRSCRPYHSMGWGERTNRVIGLTK